MSRVIRGLVTTQWAHCLPATANPLLRSDYANAIQLIWSDSGNLTERELLRIIETQGPFDFFIAGGNDQFTDRVISCICTQQRQDTELSPLISRAGVGYENIDIKAAREHGCSVAIATGNHDAVAEHTIALLLAGVGRLLENVGHARHGRWHRTQGNELRGRVCGICGFGRVGQAVARRLAGFDVELIYCDPHPEYYENVPGYRPLRNLWECTAAQTGRQLQQAATLDDLLERCDIVTLHSDLHDGNRHMIDARRLAALGPGILVNTARGGLVNQRDIGQWLQQHPDSVYATDVHDDEPRDISCVSMKLDGFLGNFIFNGLGVGSLARGSRRLLRRIAPSIGASPWAGVDQLIATNHIAPYKHETAPRVVESACLNVLRHCGLRDASVQRYIVR